MNQLKAYRSRRQPIFTVYCIGGVDISPHWPGWPGINNLESNKTSSQLTSGTFLKVLLHVVVPKNRLTFSPLGKTIFMLDYLLITVTYLLVISPLGKTIFMLDYCYIPLSYCTNTRYIRSSTFVASCKLYLRYCPSSKCNNCFAAC